MRFPTKGVLELARLPVHYKIDDVLFWSFDIKYKNEYTSLYLDEDYSKSSSEQFAAMF